MKLPIILLFLTLANFKSQAMDIDIESQMPVPKQTLIDHQAEIGQKKFFDRVAPLAVPALTGVGALLAIGVSLYDLTHDYSGKRPLEMISHLFWLSSAVVGVAYNIRAYTNNR